MAGKPKFRVPTLGEMEKAEADESLVTARPIFKRVTASKPTDGSASVKDTQPAQQQSPPKRMISKKALLSRQPLSGQRSSGSGRKKDTPKTSIQSSTDKAETPGTSKAASSPADCLGHQRVSRVTIDNVSSAKPKTSFTTDSFSSTKAVTNTWTGSTLGSDSRNAGSDSRNAGSDSRNAGSVQRMAQQPIVSISAGPVQQGAGTTITVPQQKHGAGNTEETADPDAVRADVLPTLAKLGKTNSLVVSSRQRGNPLLNFVRNVPWEFGNIVPDYVMGQSNCALFLSLRYHQLNPEYIHDRLKLLGRSFDLRVLLVQVDIKDPHHLLKDLAKICILADCTLMLAFSAEEAGRYLETYKVYENKAAEAIMERTDSSFGVQLSDCLNRVKSVNKTDCSTLLATFGSLQGIMKASTEDLSLCPGFGPQKAKRLHDVFREPFLVSKKQRGDAGK